MVSLTCTAERTDGVTLVTGRLRNPDGPRRVRVENCLDGPVWPPRTDGVPAAGWDADGCAFAAVIPGDTTRALGYATPARPADEPMTVVAADPVTEEVDGEFEPRAAVPDVAPSPAAVVRSLDSPRPPRDAVPVSGPDSGPDPSPADPGTDRERLAMRLRSDAALLRSMARQVAAPTGGETAGRAR
ncbi:MAG: hypothetical protein ABEJ30_04670 [Halorientalis sp.]